MSLSPHSSLSLQTRFALVRPIMIHEASVSRKTGKSKSKSKSRGSKSRSKNGKSRSRVGRKTYRRSRKTIMRSRSVSPAPVIRRRSRAL